MNRFGSQLSGNMDKLLVGTKAHEEIRAILKRFQEGYSGRNLDEVDSYMEELFIKGEEIYAVGTSTGELFLGSDKVKELIKSDWEYWGDVIIDWENARVDFEGEVAWFATAGSVKYNFEDSTEKYDRYIEFIKEKAEEIGPTPKQKITFINWVLSLVYHQREDGKREYFWPLRLSGVMLKDKDKWKFANLVFSIPRPDFPDERFENSREHLEEYGKRQEMAKQYKSNGMTAELINLMKALESKFFGQRDISKEVVSEYFAANSLPYIIAPENCWYEGLEGIREFFGEYGDTSLSLDIEHAIASKSDEITSVTVTGILKQELPEDELAEQALEVLDNLLKTDITSKEKIFAAHRSIAYVLKESASGSSYSCPIKLTAVVVNSPKGNVFHNIHFSYPFYWILEGKLDSI